MLKRCRPRIGIALLLLAWLGASCQLVQRPPPDSPQALLVESLDHLANVIEPRPESVAATPRTFAARYKIVEADGLSEKLLGNEIELAVQPPDRLRISMPFKGKRFQLGRDGEQLWIYSEGKKFCLMGMPGVARFNSDPNDKDTAPLAPLHFPWSRKKLELLASQLEVEVRPAVRMGSNVVRVLSLTPRPEAIRAHRLPAVRVQLCLRESDDLPVRVSYSNNRDVRVTIEAEQVGFQDAWPEEKWRFTPMEGDREQIVARSHLTQFLAARWSLLNANIPSLGPAKGERRVVASAGQGRLEMMDGTRVLFLKGSPEEMGQQHGVLLQKKIRDDVRRVLYGMGVGTSLANGTWFFGEMDAAQQRLLPHMDERYLREMDAMADAAGVSRAEVRMANMFPELFHCSGFAIFGDATAGGKLFHGRILDYFRGQGLEQNAVVMVMQPDRGNAWVNISYAGFIGSVTAMNEKHVAIGEMGGRGEGQWDGKPMAQLVREVMEKANTLDEALGIMRRSPRTCEYFYVISDGKTKRAAAVRATPSEFETIGPGEPHPLLPEAIKDAVMVSGDDRLKELIRRIKAGYGKFDAASARELMTRPVCMKSNIHSVLFEPETLDFWVANADSQNVASHTRYTHYNLRALLEEQSLASARARN